ncbi:MAG: CRTAC1 family protein [Planctomycetes bacterium]|nr:CRTAC1 family protein [Planctomycetota bacterium]
MSPSVVLLWCSAALCAPQDVRDRLFPEVKVSAPAWKLAEAEKLDPAKDAWPTEVLHDRTEPVLARFLRGVLSAGTPLAELEARFADDFRGASALVPDGLAVLASRGSFEVRRPQALDRTLRPKDAFAASVASLRKTFAGAPNPEFDLAVTALEPLDDTRFTTRAEVRAWATVGESRIALNFVWDLEWSAPHAADEPKLAALELASFEQVIAAKPPFAELTRFVVGGSREFERHFLNGIDDYYNRTDYLTGNALIGGQGLALGDIDSDGDDDLYVPMQGGIPNRLFVHEAAGDALERSIESGVAFLDNTRGALFADFDDDGDQDLAVAVGAHVVISWNRGKGEFGEPTWLVGDGMDEVFSLAAGDGDGDGDLDLYACRYVSGGMVGSVPLPYYDATNGATNFYWRNDGPKKFTNATKEAGFDQGNVRYSLSALWDDFDDDGDQDLYVANDFGRDHFWINDGTGRFVDRARELGVDDIGAGMGLTRADVDGDGRLDFYVSDMWSAPGLRITARKERFQPGVSDELRAAYVHHARGNTLWLNRGGGRYVESAVAAGVARGGWSWGALFTDFENDGRPDLYVPNGFLTWAGTTELESFFWRRVIGGSPVDTTPNDAYRHAWASLQSFSSSGSFSYNGRERNCVYLNVGGGRFADVTAASGLDYLEDSRAVARCDWDGDGREDLWLKSRTAPRLRFLHNRSLRSGHWLQVDLVGTSSNRDAIGARVTVEAGGAQIVRTLHAGEGYLAQSSKRLHFGVGDATRIDRVTVRWPYGTTETFEAPPLDARVRLVQGKPGFEVIAPANSPANSPSLIAAMADDPLSAPHESVNRVQLVEKLPLAALRIPSVAHAERTLADVRDGRPLLVRLWSTRMANDGATKLVQQSQSLATVGARVVLLSLDEGPALAKARKLLAGTPLEADSGYADGGTLEVLKVSMIELFRRADLVPAPLDLLCDADGQLVLAYLRPVDAEELAVDVELVKKLDPQSMATPKLFGGRWLNRPRRDYRELSRIFDGLGSPGMAELYRRVADERAKTDAGAR